jgi:hypothetical protein
LIILDWDSTKFLKEGEEGKGRKRKEKEGKGRKRECSSPSGVSFPLRLPCSPVEPRS